MFAGPAPTQRLAIELVKKALHNIISSRFLAGDCEERSISNTFNLETIEIESVRQAIDTILLSSDLATPVHVDICTSSNENPTVVLLERWSVSVQSSSVIRMSPGRSTSSDSLEMFQHALVMIRSLHCLLRVLPAHNLYSMGQAALDRLDPLPFAIFYFITTGTDPERSFQDADCKNFVFAPVDSAISTPRLSGSKIIPNYITSPSPKSSAARALIESHSSSIRNSLPFAILNSNPNPNCSMNTPLLKTATELQATFTPPSHLPWLDDIFVGSPSDSTTRLTLTNSRTKDDSPTFGETNLSDISPGGNDGLGFARLEQGCDHSQVGELLTVIKQAPDRLYSLPSVSLKTVLESLEESLSKNRSFK